MHVFCFFIFVVLFLFFCCCCFLFFVFCVCGVFHVFFLLTCKPCSYTRVIRYCWPTETVPLIATNLPLYVIWWKANLWVYLTSSGNRVARVWLGSQSWARGQRSEGLRSIKPEISPRADVSDHGDLGLGARSLGMLITLLITVKWVWTQTTTRRTHEIDVCTPGSPLSERQTLWERQTDRQTERQKRQAETETHTLRRREKQTR